MINHYDTCNADYPEKLKGELPQATVEIEGIMQCVDCGAYEMSSSTTVMKLGERLRRKDNKITRLKTRIKQLEKEVKSLS